MNDIAHDSDLEPEAAATNVQTEENEQDNELEEEIVAALKSVYDPEIPVDIYELGLIYELNIDADNNVDVLMTLTAPGCPVAGSMPGWVQEAVESVPGVKSAHVELAWEPPWTPEMMSMRAKLELNML